MRNVVRVTTRSVRISGETELTATAGPMETGAKRSKCSVMRLSRDTVRATSVTAATTTDVVTMADGETAAGPIN